MTTVATLTIDLLANSAKLNTELKKASKKTQSWAANTKSQIGAVSKVFAGMGAAGAAALGAIYAQSAKSADALAKTSDKLGVLPEKLTALHHAAELTGVSTEKTNMALQRMTRRVAEAAQGSGEAVGALDELGLSAEQIARLSPDEQFKAIAKAMENVGTQGDRVRLAMKLFDSEGVDLVNTLALGEAGLNAMAVEADALGLTLDRVDLAKIEAANDSFTRAKSTTAAFGNALTTELAPILGTLADEFTNAAVEAGGFGQVAQKVINGTATGVGFAADAVQGLRAVWVGVKLAVAKYMEYTLLGLTKIDEGITAFLNKIGVSSATTSESLRNMQAAFANTAGEIGEEFQNIALAPMPSEKIKLWLDDVTTKAQEAAEQVAAEKKVNIGATLSGVNTEDNETVDEKKTREKEAKEIEKIEARKYAALDSMAENHIGNIISGQQTMRSASSSLARQAVAETIKSKAVESKATGFAAIQQAWASAPFPANIPAVALTTAKTLATTAAIQALTAPSFNGGGFTGNGTRTGGLDGKGGFPAILHPNETVLDHTKGQGMGAVINIHNYSGQQVEQRQNGNEIEVIIGKAKDSIRDDINRGRGISNDFQQAFGLQRAARV